MVEVGAVVELQDKTKKKLVPPVTMYIKPTSQYMFVLTYFNFFCYFIKGQGTSRTYAGEVLPNQRECREQPTRMSESEKEVLLLLLVFDLLF